MEQSKEYHPRDTILKLSLNICPVTDLRNKDDNFFKMAEELNKIFEVHTTISWVLNPVMEAHYKEFNVVFIVEVLNFSKGLTPDIAEKSGRVVSLEIIIFKEFFETEKTPYKYVFVNENTFEKILQKFFNN